MIKNFKNSGMIYHKKKVRESMTHSKIWVDASSYDTLYVTVRPGATKMLAVLYPNVEDAAVKFILLINSINFNSLFNLCHQ